MDNRESAFTNARLGRRVFPCRPDKTPLTPRGWQDACTNEGQINAWWRHYPDALVGIACQPSGIFAVDVDDPFSFNNLVTKYGSTNVTLSQMTPRDGFHLIYKYPVDIDVPNNAGKLWPGVDLRSRGYVCTGNGYKWLGDDGIYTPVAEASAWLLKLIDEMNHKLENPRPVEKIEHKQTDGLPAYFLNRYANEARPGIRNQVGFSLAMQLRDCGLSFQDATNYMLEYSHRVPTGIHPYTETEALLTLKSAYSRTRREAAGF